MKLFKTDPGQPHEKTEEICYNLPKGDGQL